MKNIKLSIFLLLCLHYVKAQTTFDTVAAKANLNATSQKMAMLFSEKNYKDYIQYIHPKVLKMTGGKDSMAAAIEESLKAAQQQGLIFSGVTIDSATNILIAGKELQSVVTENITLKTKDGRVVAKSYLIATSDDKGKTWYFIDTSGKTLAEMKTVFPELSSKLSIPSKQQPLFYKD